MNLSSAHQNLQALQRAIDTLAGQSLSTEARHALTEIQEQAGQLEQALEDQATTQSKYISTAAHELRLPLTAIKGYADLLRSSAAGPLTEMQSSFLEIIRSNVGRMSTLITDFSEFSKLEAGRLKLDLRLIDVNVLLPGLASETQSALEAHSHQLSLDLTQALPLVLADKERFEQIVRVLLDNAIRYTPVNGQIHLSSQARPDAPGVRVNVTDNGIGIDAADQAHIFTAFYRSEHPQVRSEQGWGLSLSVCHALASAMGGQLGFDSQPGSGSSFWLDLAAV